ncbi:acetyl-CoA carboxylase, biotin carboxyl carrier protein [Alphaproteobacteria bacterium]|nr:acetyl-CoA carboxylase, biotin carboxyl carrier protein [Alphaproteobacteria bacterium]
MIDKKFENSIQALIKILKKEKLSSIKVSNKSNTIEISDINNFKPEINRSNKIEIVEENIKKIELQLTIDSPMVGIVYLTPKPGSPHFVKRGQKIKKGTTICLIEAMKTFNEIKADKDGTVLNILINNEDAVEFGQPIIELK